MKKDFFKSMTFWGSVLLFVGGGLEAIGVSGALEVAGRICVVLGLPTIAFGIRRALA